MQQDKKPLGLRKRKKSNLTPAQSSKLDSMIKNFNLRPEMGPSIEKAKAQIKGSIR